MLVPILSLKKCLSNEIRLIFFRQNSQQINSFYVHDSNLILLPESSGRFKTRKNIPIFCYVSYKGSVFCIFVYQKITFLINSRKLSDFEEPD